MKILLPAMMIAAMTTAIADPITLNIINVQIDHPAGFRKLANDGKFDYFRRNDGAGYRIAVMPQGMRHEEEDETAFLWAALTSSLSFNGFIRIALDARVCIGVSCASTRIVGVMEWTPLGLGWHTPPANVTLKAGDGQRLSLSFVTNLPGGARGGTPLGTIDLGVIGRIVPTVLPPSQVPEPSCLLLLGSGLVAMAKRLRNRDKSKTLGSDN